MKFLICLFILCFSVLPTNAVTLKGGIAYTVEQARTEAFDGIEYSLPAKIIKKNKTDPNYDINKMLILPAKIIKKNKTDPNYDINKMLIENDVDEVADRFVTRFSDGSYGIIYKDNACYEYYYDKNGKLERVGKRISLIYPTKSFKYDKHGKLKEVNLYKNETHFYIFNEKKELLYHWINDKCYDKNGNIVIYRY